MASRRTARWIWVALFVLTGISPILVGIYNAITCPSLCGVAPTGYGSVLGISSVAMGMLLLFLGSRYRQHPQRLDRIQDCIFAIGFSLAGVVLFFRGWRLSQELVLAFWIFV